METSCQAWLFLPWAAHLQGSQSLTFYGSSWAWLPGSCWPGSCPSWSRRHVFSSRSPQWARAGWREGWSHPYLRLSEWLGVVQDPRCLGEALVFGALWTILVEVMFFQRLSPLSLQLSTTLLNFSMLWESWKFQRSMSKVVIKTWALFPLS